MTNFFILSQSRKQDKGDNKSVIGVTEVGDSCGSGSQKWNLEMTVIDSARA